MNNLTFADGFWAWLGIVTAETLIALAVLLVVGIIVFVIRVKEDSEK